MKGLKKHSHQDRERVIRELVPLIKKKFGDNLIALAADASYARGEDFDYSDLELFAFVKEMPEGKGMEGMSRIRDGMLVELIWTTREWYLAKVKEVTEEWYIAGSDTLLPIINEEFILSRTEVTQLIRAIMEKYPPRREIDPVALADGFMSAFEGAFILSKSLNEADITVKQLRLYKTTIEALFLPN